MLLAVALDPYLQDWLDLLIRGLHVIAAIAWIGSSFYFVMLDSSLRRPTDPADEEAGVKGELWEVHGGGFYHVQKYQVTPGEMPDHLAWFKWEAYTTWISGFALFVILYWADAGAYMIDPSVRDIGPWAAVGVSAALLVVAWVVYDVLCRALGSRERLLAASIVAGTVLAVWGTSELYSPRAAWLQTGAMIGTIMAANVFFNIIPAHWELIRAKQQGREPDPAPGIEAKRRSVHNNYFTLPVLLTMLAGHFAFLTGHDRAWLLLVVLMGVGALIRHFFNLHHQGRTSWWILALCSAVVFMLAITIKPEETPTATSSADGRSKQPAAAEGKVLFATSSCGSCHTLADAGAAGRSGPNLDDAQPAASIVVDRVTNGKGGMPPFSGKLDEQEIETLAEYVSGAAVSNGDGGER